MKERNLGLDIARSIAIIFVLVSHSRAFFKSYDLQFLSIYGMLSSKSQGVKELMLAITITLIMATLINKFYEIPIMNLRDKISFVGKKNNIKDAKSIS